MKDLENSDPGSPEERPSKRLTSSKPFISNCSAGVVSVPSTDVGDDGSVGAGRAL
jgi:hypothetical protein